MLKLKVQIKIKKSTRNFGDGNLDTDRGTKQGMSTLPDLSGGSFTHLGCKSAYIPFGQHLYSAISKVC
jgi:hypothetical protein